MGRKFLLRTCLALTALLAAAFDEPQEKLYKPIPQDFFRAPSAERLAEIRREEAARPKPGRNPDGTTLTYTRSNQNGTRSERIYVHVISATELHVAKMVERCTDAAYVTAVFDRATKEATRLVGGRLKRDGTQDPQAFLDFDPKTRKLSIRLGDPKAAPNETLAAPPAPWRMYDFDFAEFALFGAGEAPGTTTRKFTDFSFGLVMAWPDGSSPLVRKLGRARAELIVHSKQPIFAVSGEPFGSGGGGVIKFDPNRGHVVEADLSLPNHPGYEDFHLALDAFNEKDGKQVWRDALAAHWKDCPA
ncbi:MAG: hypothetical protein Q8R02_16645 [Hyphomonadaceae bacterium]|nr:hypothetical protein [Hyphomonadaceae bacterium]